MNISATNNSEQKMTTVQTAFWNNSDVNFDTLNENQTNLNRQYYYYNYGSGEPFNIFDLLPVTYRNARIFLYNYLVIIIWIVSILGNTLVILVLSKKRNRRFSTSIYLKGLALADLSVNTSNTFILYFLAHGYINPPASDNECRYRNVFQFSIAFISTWMLVVISIERVMSVWMPFKVKRLCTANIAHVIIIAIWILFLGLGFLHESVMVYFQLGCTITPEYSELYHNYLTWVLISIKYIIPYAIIFTSSIIIIATLLNRKIRKHSSEKRNRDGSVNIALLSVNIVFLLTNSPYIFFYLFAEYTSFDDENILLSYAYYFFWKIYLQVVNDCNSAVNVFVYFLVGSRFRADVKELIFGCFRKDRASLMAGNRKDIRRRDTTLSTTESTVKGDNITSSKAKVFRHQDSQFAM
ncbi:kappa-type opioid receptor-like [Mercenaria mercenaria]|uniref:kappa-type opioid receptor-like n=1 Tax=Mercenaria mercenaria TaxID=6596 RepID=UPI00234ED981|nr:kappa-type opioid receptor-like [Mercenaria mercenaria]